MSIRFKKHQPCAAHSRATAPVRTLAARRYAAPVTAFEAATLQRCQRGGASAPAAVKAKRALSECAVPFTSSSGSGHRRQPAAPAAALWRSLLLLYSAAAEQRDTGNPSPSTKPLLTKHKPSYCYYVARSPLKLTVGPNVKKTPKIKPKLFESPTIWSPL